MHRRVTSAVLSVFVTAFTGGAMSIGDTLCCQPALAQETKSQGSESSAQTKTQDTGTSPNRPIRDKWAVVIGVDKFVDPRIPSLRYSAKDAEDFAKFLVEKGNFKKDHVLTLLNEEATENNIELVIGDDWLPRRVLEDDVIVIYASTHGSPKELDVAGENFLIAHDTNPDNLYSTGLELESLAQTIKRRTRCDRVVVFLDACNSGAAATGGGKGLTRTGNFELENVAGQGMIVISSSSADQRSWESTRYKNGVFTKNLLDALLVKGEGTTLSTAFNELRDSVEQEVKFDRRVDQTPIMLQRWNGSELALLAPPSKPRSSPPFELPKVAVATAKVTPNIVQPAATSAAVPIDVTTPAKTPKPPHTPKPPVEKQPTTETPETKVTKPPADTSSLIAVVPFGGPVKVQVYPSEGCLWGIVQGPEELMDLSSTLSESINKELEKQSKTKNRVVPPIKMGEFMRSSFPTLASQKVFDTRAWGPTDWAAVKSKLTTPTPYLLVGTVDEATWRPTTWSNRYSFTATAKVIEVQTGKTLVSVNSVVTKAPWTGDTGGGKKYFENTVVPDMAQELVKKLMAQMKNHW